MDSFKDNVHEFIFSAVRYLSSTNTPTPSMLRTLILGWRGERMRMEGPLVRKSYGLSGPKAAGVHDVSFAMPPLHAERWCGNNP